MKDEYLDFDYMQKVSEVYLDLIITQGEGSISETARVMKIARTKVKKILITLGHMKSPLSAEILQQVAEGVPLRAIAREYDISVSTLSSYLPYMTAMHSGALKSPEAIRKQAYRSYISMLSQKVLSLPEEQREVYRSPSSGAVVKESSEVYRVELVRLHLQLINDLNAAEAQTLQRLGGLEHGKTITRDVLVPIDMTLHALHYLIQRAFGWQNSHLHMYYLPEETMKQLLKGGVISWCKQVGILFRSPYMDESAPFWDDDYEDGSLKNWLRSKYTGPYASLCSDESYEKCAKDMKEFKREYQGGRFVVEYRTEEVEENGKVIQVPVPMACYAADGKSQPVFGDSFRKIEGYFTKEMFFEQLPFEAIQSLFDMFDTRQLLERLTVGDVLALEGERFCDVEKPKLGKKGVTDVLLYEYDFGDRWELRITGSWRCDDLGEAGRVTQEELDAARETVWKTYRPVCIASDGYHVMDDVGGLSGFVDFLYKLDEKVDEYDSYVTEEMANLRTWSRSQGWSKRKTAPKNLL